MHPFDVGFQHQTRRIFYALNQQFSYLQKMQKWLAESREASNFTYDLEPNNLGHLAGFVGALSGLPLSRVEGHIGELAACQRIQQLVRDLTTQTELQFFADAEARPGRRIGWYAIARARKPGLVVETGVDKGFGSCVLAEALRRNRDEGYPGKLVAVDVVAGAGVLLRKSEYSEFGEVVCSDAVAYLNGHGGGIDLLVSDSDHSPGYEEREFEAAQPKMSAGGIILSDNAHGSDALYRHAKKYGKQFLYFQERPLDHVYPGAGIGACY